MGAAIIGLVGVFFGALMTQAGAIITNHRQARSESARWRRDQKVAAYDGVIRYLLRGTNRRSSLTVQAGKLTPIISQEHVREMFDDFVEGQFWLHVLMSRCGPNQLKRVQKAATILDEEIQRATGIGSSGPVKFRPKSYSFIEHAPEIINIITDCAREDVDVGSQ